MVNPAIILSFAKLTSVNKKSAPYLTPGRFVTIKIYNNQLNPDRVSHALALSHDSFYVNKLFRFLNSLFQCYTRMTW